MRRRALFALAFLSSLACSRAPQTRPGIEEVAADPRFPGLVLIEDSFDHVVVHGRLADADRAKAGNPRALGEQKTAVMLVNFPDKPLREYSVAEIQQQVFTSLSDFYRLSSYNQTWVTGDVYGWFTINLPSTTCDAFALSEQARAAATSAGAVLENYKRYVYIFPQNACNWWGYGSVGGEPSQAWINGTVRTQVLAHEMGHNLGLGHAKGKTCGSTTLTEPCDFVEYGDPFDTMGYATGQFSAFNKELLMWLSTPLSRPQTTVTTSGTYTIDSYESTTDGPKALKVVKPDNTLYYVEARQGGGGILIRSALNPDVDGAAWNSLQLLDMTPQATPRNWNDAQLVQGRQFTDSFAQITIGAAAVGTASATIAVTFGQAPPNPPTPPGPTKCQDTAASNYGGTLPCVYPPTPPPPTPTYDFVITAVPVSQSVKGNKQASYQLSVSPADENGLVPTVTFTATTDPVAAKVSIDKKWVLKANYAKKGHVTITVTGTGAGKVHTLTLGLDVV